MVEIAKRRIMGSAREFFRAQGITDEEIDTHNAEIDTNSVTN